MNNLVNNKYGFVENVECEQEYKNIDYRDTTVPLWETLYKNKNELDAYTTCQRRGEVYGPRVKGHMIEKKKLEEDPQMVFALRLAQKLVQRDQVVHDVRVWLKHVDKFKLGYLTRGEFRAMLRTFGVPEQPGQPFQYDDIFGSHNTAILDYRGFIHLVEVALEQYINPFGKRFIKTKMN